MNHPRSCPITGKTLEGFHGNRKVHPEAEKTKKDLTNKKRHSKVKDMNKQALRLDKILEYYYPTSDGKVEIEKNMLRGFAWDFITRISNESTLIFWILDYGYSYSSDKKKIKIHYGNDQL